MWWSNFIIEDTKFSVFMLTLKKVQDTTPLKVLSRHNFRRWDNHFSSKFSYSIQHRLEVPTNGLYGPPKSKFYHSEPLLVANNMQEHGHLFLKVTMDIVPQKTPGSK